MKQVDKYTALNLEDKGKYGFQLVEGWVGKDGDFKPNFCVRELGKEKKPTKIPVNVKLGDRAKAIEVCLWMYRELSNGEDLPF